MSRWRSPDELTFRPAALERLAASLEHLHLVAYPRTPSSPVVGARGSGWSDAPTPDAARAKYRRALKRVLADVDRIATKALALATDQFDHGPRRGWRCAACRTGQRPQARWCDQCGSPRGTETAS